MNRLLLILILTLSFQTLTKADDIRDFQIEGMSIGDSALDYFNKKAIEDNTWVYPNKKFKRVQNDDYDFFKIYNSIDFHYKYNDKKYTIHSISGILDYKDNIEQCYDKMDEIIVDIKSVFSRKVVMTEKSTFSHPSPKNVDGKSKVTVVNFIFPNDDELDVACYDYSEAHGSQDHLNFNISTNNFSDWIKNEAYN
ncbi:hypothetical protein [Candidatus Pelagibacter sp. Uisw_127]|uniref:hypothetical protein n=1 Tax=Candidatus Pelagibacter sp. Uisw_127 TaxID=3230988 RepID=UPI0039EB6F07